MRDLEYTRRLVSVGRERLTSTQVAKLALAAVRKKDSQLYRAIWEDLRIAVREKYSPTPGD